MSDQFDLTNDFEKLLLARAVIKDLQQKNLKCYDEVLRLQEANKVLKAQLKDYDVDAAQEIRELKTALQKAQQMDPETKAILLLDDYAGQLKKLLTKANETNAILYKQIGKVNTEFIRYKQSQTAPVPSQNHPIMFIHDLKGILMRDLNALRTEINAYPSEAHLWLTPDGISNSAGNLCLHLVGNLNWFIGAQLGNTGYQRNRPLEFSTKDVPREELLQQIDITMAMLRHSLDHITVKQLESDYPLVVFTEPMSTMQFLLHLASHLAYHLGQINYHRRLVSPTN
jgi:hypothetical protein